MKKYKRILAPYTEKIMVLHREGISQRRIADILCAEGIRCSRSSVYNIIKANTQERGEEDDR